MKRFIVSEETKESVGMELVDDVVGGSIILRDIDTIDDNPAEYYILVDDIPRLIEGLRLFIEE